MARLKAYKQKLILFPRNTKKPKKGDNPADLSKTETVARSTLALPIVPVDLTIKEIKKGDVPAAVEGGAYRKLREARAEKRYAGAKEKRAAEKADAEASKK